MKCVSSTGDAPVLATVGDISCQPGSVPENEKTSDLCTADRNQAQAATANQIEAMKPNLVAVLGDLQYQVGRYEDFTGSYDKTYGAFKFLQRPSPGNHEFYDRGTPGAGAKGETGVGGYGYFDYFNGFQLNPDGTPVTQSFTQKFVPGSFTQPVPRQQGQAGDFGTTGNGWYSYNLGHWHLISLNVECAVEPGGCDPSGAWFASGTKWLAQDLAANRGECTLASWHQPTFSSTASPFTSDSAVMKMRLGPGGYTWDFESSLESSTARTGTPATYSDTGIGRCHGPVEQHSVRHGHA